ncbi:hypothetical protein [Glycomyces paridis]|uniref:Uncharacterized protein n=1 Tax=Glycomyces paridis TaxID=2126555 RepID=A0A4S8P092_9ACTN|nr:hypothetical protein [Glycomyces paridis]THV23450.1 hypothetical protein E9998_22870 [Glycomyces paridis]
MTTTVNRKALYALITSILAAAFFMSAAPAQAAESGTAARAAAVETVTDDFGIQTSADCVYYLRAVGYAVGPTRTQACNTGAGGQWFSQVYCIAGLINGGVSDYHAANACKLAA